MKHLWLICLLSIFPSGLLAQNQKNEKPPNDLIVRYQKSHDWTTVSTKPVDLFGSTERGSYFTSMTLCASFSGKVPVPEKTEIFLIFSPESTSFALSLARELSSAVGKPRRTLWLDHQTEIIFSVEGERIKLPDAKKESLSVMRDLWKDSAITIITLPILEKLTAANLWEVSLDTYQCRVEADKWGQRVNPRLKAFTEYMSKLRQDAPASKP